ELQPVRGVEYLGIVLCACRDLLLCSWAPQTGMVELPGGWHLRRSDAIRRVLWRVPACPTRIVLAARGDLRSRARRSDACPCTWARSGHRAYSRPRILPFGRMDARVHPERHLVGGF